ncbi:MAG: DUF3604 domain-containing protein [Chloroflexota bacterium]
MSEKNVDSNHQGNINVGNITGFGAVVIGSNSTLNYKSDDDSGLAEKLERLLATHEKRRLPLGTVTLDPQTPVVAGVYGTWTLTYTVGSLGIDSGGQIKVALRLVSDWANPQVDDPQAEGYCTAVTDGPAKLRVSWQQRGHIRPKTKCIVMDVYDGSLYPGDTVTITLGDTSHGSPGIRAQTYIESHFGFFVLVDPTNACDPRPLDESPMLQIVPAEMKTLVCLLPSQAKLNTLVDIFVKGEDMWRNPIPVIDNVQFEWVGSNEVEIDGSQLTAHQAGSGYLIAKSAGFTCQSNPIEFREQTSALQHYWGDIHAQTAETVGVGTEDEYFTFGREWGRLDFTSHQGNDFQMRDEYWQHLNETTQKYHEDGRFVVFPGYEWSASSPTGGDHNVIYRNEGYPIMRSSHWLIDTPANALSPAHPADVFYARMKENVPLHDVLVCMHVGGRYANMHDFFDQELITLVELVSCWGVFEWMLWDAFERDYIVGVMCNSDGHHGRPGAEGAGMEEFGIRSGLTCVLAESLTRDGIFDALKQRHCYGTTGARMLLDFQAGDVLMGSIITDNTGTINITASVTGTGPLESLQLFQGKEVIHEVRPPAFDKLTQSTHIRVSWQGSRERGRQRRATWDGAVRVEGCQIESASLFSFDTVLDGIVEQSPTQVTFRSRTTGDRDGLDLVLDDARDGTVIFDSGVGTVSVNLADLTDEQSRMAFDMGGVDMQVIIERYPATVEEQTLALETTVTPAAGKLTPYFVKATQVDGEMAWASPVYVDLR